MKLTAHALQRLEEMGLSPAEVSDAVHFPILRYPSPPRHGAGRMISVGGRVAVVHTDDTVITVLWHRRTGRDEAA